MHIDMYIPTLVTNTTGLRMTESILEVKSKFKRRIFVKSKEIFKDFLFLVF